LTLIFVACTLTLNLIYGVLMSRFLSTSACVLCLGFGGALLSGCNLSSGVSNPFISDKSSHYYAIPPHNTASAVEQPEPVRFKRVTSETLLNADGNFNMVEDSHSVDPAKAHLAARKQVNIRNFKKKAELSPHFSPNAKSGEDGTLRVLRIAGVAPLDDYDVIARSVLRPSTVLDEDVDRGMRNGSASKTEYDVTPSRKPVAVAARLAQIEAASGDVEAVIENGKVLRPPSLPAWRVTKVYARKDKPEAVASADQKTYVHPQAQDVLSGIVVIPPKRSKPVKKSRPLSHVTGDGVAVPGYKPNAVMKVKRGNVDGFQRADAARIEKAIQNTRDIAAHKGQVDGGHRKVTDIRAGRHGGNHRIVLEVSEKPSYRVKVDSLRGVLQMKLDHSDWNLSPQSRFEGSGLFGTYVARQSADGSVFLEVRLKHKTHIVREMILKPGQVRSDGPPVYRLVLDLAT